MLENPTEIPRRQSILPLFRGAIERGDARESNYQTLVHLLAW